MRTRLRSREQANMDTNESKDKEEEKNWVWEMGWICDENQQKQQSQCGIQTKPGRGNRRKLQRSKGEGIPQYSIV